MPDSWIVPRDNGSKTISQFSVPSHLFNAMHSIDLDKISEYSSEELSSIAVPFLTKLLLNPYFTKRYEIVRILYPIKRANDMIQLMQADPISQVDLVPSPGEEFKDVDFESGSPRDRLRIVANEYRRIQELARKTNLGTTHQNTTQTTAMKLQESWLFDNPLYVQDVSLCLFALLNKPTNIPVINILEMSEALLYVANGFIYILYLVSNMPDRCQDIYQSLITFGEKYDGSQGNEVADQRARTLRQLCRMSPQIRLRVRTLALQTNLMPSLTLMITLDQLMNYESESETDEDNTETGTYSDQLMDLDSSYDSSIAFVKGTLLSDDEATKLWFAHYIKSAQNQSPILNDFRRHIVDRIKKIMPFFTNGESLDVLNQSYKLDGSESDANFLNRKLIQATATLKYFCALRGIGMLKLNSQESELLLALISCRPPASQTSVNFATVGVCTLIVCSSMINGQKEERKAAEWLKWLIKESDYSNTTYSSHGKCSISELLLLIAIHFQNNQTNQIAELVCATLGMKLQIKASVSKCKSLFVQEVFNDQIIAEHAVEVPVTYGLNDNIKEFLPIHCIHQLLELRAFSKYQVPIKDWIYKQICGSKKPVHHMLPRLIEAYVESVILNPSICGYIDTSDAIAPEEIAKIFKTKLYSLDMDEMNKSESESPGSKKRRKTRREKSPEPMQICEHVNGASQKLEVAVVDYEVAQVLFLYYVTLYEDVRLTNYNQWKLCVNSKPVKYDLEFMMEIPVFYLVQLARDNQDMFATIFPYLLKLIATQYPHLCSIQHWLNITDHYEPYNSRATRGGSIVGQISAHESPTSQSDKRNSTTHLINLQTQLSDAFKVMHEEPIVLSSVIHSIIQLPRHEIWVFVDIFVNNWHQLLALGDSLEHQRLAKLITRLWWRLNTTFPRKLWIMTTNSLRRSQTNKSISTEAKTLEYSWKELTSDPLIVLRCDSRVFRCPLVLDIILHVLSGFLAAAQRCLQDHIYRQRCIYRQEKARNLEELKATLVLAQTSAAIQILLEYCSPTEEEAAALVKRRSNTELDETERSLLKKFDTSVDCICEHLHQVFIADTNLAKLVHFQTYPSELLSTTSNKIPSMHICLDFIPELLSQPDLSKQVFVIELTSHLCEKYAITKSLNVAKLCFNVAFTLLQLLPSDKRALFYIPTLPALMRICKVFPILLEDISIILNQIHQITLAHLASTSSRLSLGSTNPFGGLEKMSWHEVNKLMRQLNLDEALFLCIQKCQLDTCAIQQ